MTRLARWLDDALEALEGRRFDGRMVGRDAIDLGPQADRVRGIAARLNRYRRGRPKDAVVLWTTKLTAITKRGPWVYIAREVVDRLSDDAVAFILAHEMAHHDLRHLSPTLVAAAMIGESQRMELQADRLGLELARATGFDGRGALEALDPAFWKPPPREPWPPGSPGMAAWLDRFRYRHPTLEARIAALRQQLATPTPS